MKMRKIYWIIVTAFTFICIMIQMKEHQVSVKQHSSEKRTTVTKTQSANFQQSSNEILTVENPDATEVVVNKNRKLPDNYVPNDLVIPNIPFAYEGEVEKRYIRKEAARALEELFSLGKEQGIFLQGVSGYRSYERQRSLYQYYTNTYGEEETKRFSSKPGNSEHQTGLAIDISSKSANSLLEESFGETKEGKWLAEHAHEAGFIIRYPKGKENITGYQYEPWHIRYVGKEAAQEIYNQQITLEEYMEEKGELQ